MNDNTNDDILNPMMKVPHFYELYIELVLNTSATVQFHLTHHHLVQLLWTEYGCIFHDVVNVMLFTICAVQYTQIAFKIH